MEQDSSQARTVSQKLFFVIVLFSMMLVPVVIFFNKTVDQPPQVIITPVTQDTEIDATATTPDSLTLHKWEFLKSEYESTEITPKKAGVFTMSFFPDNTVHITTDCNTLNGTFTTQGFSLTFSPLVSTKMYCDDSQETEFTEVLSRVHAYSISENGDLLLSFAKSGVVTFAQMQQEKTIADTSTKPVLTPTSTPLSKECFVGGCSNEICSERNDVVSTCIWREEFACYQKAVCERQTSGSCGWTKSPELNACLTSASESDEVYSTQ